MSARAVHVLAFAKVRRSAKSVRHAILSGQLNVRYTKYLGQGTYRELCVFADLPDYVRRCRVCGTMLGFVAVDLTKGDLQDLRTAMALLFLLYERGTARHGNNLCEPEVMRSVSRVLTPVRYQAITK